MSRRPFTTAEAIERLRAACDGAGGQRAWARRNGVSQTHFSQVLSGDKGFSLLLAACLGLEGEMVWRPAAEPRP